VTHPTSRKTRFGQLCMLPIFLSLALVCCSSGGKPATLPNPVLRTLVNEDQAVRRGDSAARSDADRVHLVLEQLAMNAARTPMDQFSAALVLDHSPLKFVNDSLVAVSPDNYLLAHYLARQAFESGYADAGPLVAMTIDRYLTFTIGVQRYGTNRLINQATGAEELVAIDRTTTDEERAKYGIAPLAALLARYPERPPPKAAPPKKE
jgi:hypothetical protein